MRSQIWPLMMVFVFILQAAGCGRQEEKPAMDAPEADKAASKEYPITGRVVSITPDKSAVTIDHKDIPGLMPGMEMQFTVDDPQILEGVETGSDVEGQLKVEGSKYIITSLKKR